MKKKELYVCEICGAEYGTESEAIACEEDGHTKIEQIRYEYLIRKPPLLQVGVCSQHENIPTKSNFESG